MQLSCPKCGTRDVRVSHRQGIAEHIRRSLDTAAHVTSAWLYARCPKCYRQELTTCSEQYYHPPRWTLVMLRCGATPYRCAACRCNFASFRPCKERFSWRHQNRTEQTSEATKQ